jgi:hypothetical protein
MSDASDGQPRGGTVSGAALGHRSLAARGPRAPRARGASPNPGHARWQVEGYQPRVCSLRPPGSQVAAAAAEMAEPPPAAAPLDGAASEPPPPAAPPLDGAASASPPRASARRRPDRPAFDASMRPVGSIARRAAAYAASAAAGPAGAAEKAAAAQRELDDLRATLAAAGSMAPSAWVKREHKYRQDLAKHEHTIAMLRERIDMLEAEVAALREGRGTQPLEARIEVRRAAPAAGCSLRALARLLGAGPPAR